MIEALLLDLDDTLLQSDMDEFLPAYTQRLSQALAEFAEPEQLVPQLMAATRAMIENLDPTRTLKDTFDGRFYPAIEQDSADMRPAIDRFYETEYPELRELTEPMPGSAELLAAARQHGLDVVIATNPLFPLTAIEQRLEWAGIAPDDDHYLFATSYESAHFAKPQPAYYAEILGRLGVRAERSAFIGDNPTNDLAPARALGLHVFHKADEPGNGHPGGDLLEAEHWLQRLLSKEDDQEHTAQPASALAQARGYLAALLTMYPGRSEVPLDERPSSREWAPVEILCHLRDTEREVHQPRLRRLLTESSPFFSAVDSDEWAEERRYLDQDPKAALDSFVEAREETIAQLANLSEEEWQLPARHAIFGPTTLVEIVAVAVDHDLAHLGQLRRTLEELRPTGD